MNILATIGAHNSSIEYKDRLTVKALILNDTNQILIINNGLLPGGGVEDDEDAISALSRESIEEVGVTISDINDLGTVIQYRDHIHRKYIIHGYTAHFVHNQNETNPQNQGEADFTHGWYGIDDAIGLVTDSIQQMKDANIDLDGANQGKLFNLMTTLELLNSFAKRS